LVKMLKMINHCQNPSQVATSPLLMVGTRWMSIWFTGRLVFWLKGQCPSNSL
jgi:hypothetical protein